MLSPNVLEAIKKDPVIKHLIKFAHLHFSPCLKVIKTHPEVKQFSQVHKLNQKAFQTQPRATV